LQLTIIVVFQYCSENKLLTVSLTMKATTRFFFLDELFYMNPPTITRLTEFSCTGKVGKWSKSSASQAWQVCSPHHCVSWTERGITNSNYYVNDL